MVNEHENGELQVTFHIRFEAVTFLRQKHLNIKRQTPFLWYTFLQWWIHGGYDTLETFLLCYRVPLMIVSLICAQFWGEREYQLKGGLIFG